MKKLRKWSQNNPKNYLHKYLLVKAEYFRLKEKLMDAMDLYEGSIVRAKSNAPLTGRSNL